MRTNNLLLLVYLACACQLSLAGTNSNSNKLDSETNEKNNWQTHIDTRPSMWTGRNTIRPCSCWGSCSNCSGSPAV
ncbi:hypothetical protein C8J57DRAFT_1275773 [Mycena rebaudengoi]|nr:hypothetical protein C8J57DRAFT_1275773 [Mycena rebaudengoi]